MVEKIYFILEIVFELLTANKYWWKAVNMNWKAPHCEVSSWMPRLTTFNGS